MSSTIKPIRTALCSFGMSGWVFHAPFIAINPGFELYAVWERTKNLAAEKYPAIKTVRSLEELLQDDSIELLVINTPNTTHYEYTKKALLAGKHVLVEKPFTVTVAEGEELVALAKQCNKLITVYHNRRFDSDYRTVKKVVDEKLLGRIVEAEIHYDRFKEEPGPKLHKETPGPGTGLLYDLGSHLIDQALQFFGMPDSIFADITIMRKLSKVDDYMELILYYPGLRARVKSSYLVRESLPSYVFHGTKGSFIKARTDVQEVMLQAHKIPGGPEWGVEPDNEKGLLNTEIDGKIIREYIPSLKGNYGDIYDDLYKAIRENDPVPVTAEQGLNVIRIIEAAYESNRQKKIVAINK
ncbi:MAG TPA: Gfo/Idh/MocA family oxidoreductase [Chitinophagaceae bacterium]|jgi:scyllo-inositol 2-dehydrogenase (NADP+)|nr:Gfo/Idh/MocA family oxidoreductase [Chitinophagaceae bacterium]